MKNKFIWKSRRESCALIIWKHERGTCFFIKEWETRENSRSCKPAQGVKHRHRPISRSYTPTRLKELCFEPARELEKFYSNPSQGAKLQPGSMRRTPTWVKQTNFDLVLRIESMKFGTSSKKRIPYFTSGKALITASTSKSTLSFEHIKLLSQEHSKEPQLKYQTLERRSSASCQGTGSRQYSKVLWNKAQWGPVRQGLLLG